MAHIMLNLGAQQAMNLDGGSSSGLWCRGKSIVSPGRLLSNAILITKR
jgi:exopolysaccharide biosynthesis protein